MATKLHQVAACLETDNDKITIKFRVSDTYNDTIKQDTYYLTTDPEHEIIDVHVIYLFFSIM